MATWFDKYRGEGQGRCKPGTLQTADGEYMFVLGGDAITVPATLTDGVYSEVSQAVDLTSYDVVSAVLETKGCPMSQFVTPDQLPNLTGTMGRWLLDEAADLALDSSKFGRHLTPNAFVTVAGETYSTSSRNSREWAAGGDLSGIFTPGIGVGAIDKYSWDGWINFDADFYPASTGLDIDLFRCVAPGVGGLAIYLAGVFGGHEWNVAVDHFTSVGNMVQSCPAYGFTTSDGWHFVTLVYDVAEAGLDQLKLYVDGVFVSSAAGAVPAIEAPSDGTALSLGDAAYVGEMSQIRWTSAARTAANHADDYLLTTSAASSRSAIWRMELRIGGVPYATRIIRPTEARRLVDFRAPVRHLAGVHTVTLRLILEAA